MDARSYEQPPKYPLRKRDLNSVTDREQPTVTKPDVETPTVRPTSSAGTGSQETLILTKSVSSNRSRERSPPMKKLQSKPSSLRDTTVSRATTATSETPQPTTTPLDDENDENEEVEKDAFEVVLEPLGRFFYLEEQVHQEEKLDEFSSASVIVAAAKRVKEIRLEQEAARTLPLVPATVWLSQWVDYTSKYGMGYVLTDGSSGVYFNDSTKIISSSDARTLEYMERAAELSSAPEPFVRVAHDTQDATFKKKVTLLSHFKSYLVDERDKKPDIAAFDIQVRSLAANHASSTPDRMVYVKKWVKTKHAVLFCLSNQTYQFNFFDASKLLLSYLDKEGKLGVFSTAVTILNREPSDLAKRLRYARDMFEQIARVNATVAAQAATGA